MTIIDPVTPAQFEHINATYGMHGNAIIAVQKIGNLGSVAVCQVNGQLIEPYLMLVDDKVKDTVEVTETSDGILKFRATNVRKSSRRGRRFVRGGK